MYKILTAIDKAILTSMGGAYVYPMGAFSVFNYHDLFYHLYLFFFGPDRFIGPIQLCILPHERKSAEKKNLSPKEKKKSALTSGAG